ATDGVPADQRAPETQKPPRRRFLVLEHATRVQGGAESSRLARPPRTSAGARQAGRRAAAWQRRPAATQRLENCLARRAECRPTFLRSTSRASRVTKPAALSWGLSVAS